MNVNELRKERSPTADSAERRAVTKRNPEESSAEATQSAEHAWNGLDRVRKAAERDKTSRFTALFHHITPELLEEAYYKLNKKAKVGVDGVTWEVYKDMLNYNLTRRL